MLRFCQSLSGVQPEEVTNVTESSKAADEKTKLEVQSDKVEANATEK